MGTLAVATNGTPVSRNVFSLHPAHCRGAAMPTGAVMVARRLRLRRSVSCHGMTKLNEELGSARSASVTHAQAVLVSLAGAVSDAQDEICLPLASSTCNRTDAPLNVA